MGIYDFVCSKCGYRIKDVWIPKKGEHKGKRWMDCPKCGDMAKKQDYSDKPTHLDRRG